jgi:hypothetical protein
MALATPELSKRRTQIVTATTGAICSVFIPVWCQVVSAVYVAAEEFSNDIRASNHPIDNDFAMIVDPVTLDLERDVTDVSRFPESVNVLGNEAANLQLKDVSVLTAATTATDRFFTALDAGDTVSAQARLTQVKNFVSDINSVSEATAAKLEDFARELQTTRADFVVDRNAFNSFQDSLRTVGFPPEELSLSNDLLSKIDPIAVSRVVDPIAFASQLFSSVDFPSPTETLNFSDAILQEADAIRSVPSVVGPFPMALPVAEPGTFLLVCSGLAGLVLFGRKRFLTRV